MPSFIEPNHTEHVEIININSTPEQDRSQEVISIGSTPEQPINPANNNFENNFLRALFALSFGCLGQQQPQEQPRQ